MPRPVSWALAFTGHCVDPGAGTLSQLLTLHQMPLLQAPGQGSPTVCEFSAPRPEVMGGHPCLPVHCWDNTSGSWDHLPL